MNQFIKVSSLVVLLSASVIFSGCSDETQEEKAKSNIATASGIEVVANSNANEVKVEEKAFDPSRDKSYYFDNGVKAGYAQNSQPANPDASVRVKPRTNIDANLHVRSPYEEVQVSMMVRKLSKKFIVKCSACHNDFANGIIGPSLLSKDSDFIYKKIKAFKEDKTLNVLMSGLVENMDDAEIREMADEVYKFNLEIKKMRNQ